MKNLQKSIVCILVSLFVWHSAARAQVKAPAPPQYVIQRLEQDRPLFGKIAMASRKARRLLDLGDDVETEMARLEEEGFSLFLTGNTGEGRRLLYQALTLAASREWTARDEYARSLLLTTDTTICDPSSPFVARLKQIYSATYEVEAPLKMRVAILKTRRTPPVKEVGTFQGLSVDFIDEPFAFSVDLSDLDEGNYLLGAEVFEGDVLLRRLAMPVCLVNGLDVTRRDVKRRLDSVPGHASAKATVMYPFDFAVHVNLGMVDPRTVDFRVAIDQSEELLSMLENGNDPLYQSVGDNKRHYWLEEAKEIMPYRLFVPENYDPNRAWPLIVALHGHGGTEDVMIGGNNGMIKKLAEEHGYIVAAPLGYRRDGAYGRVLSGITQAHGCRVRKSELSEKDVMSVLDLVRKEYNIDADRTYLLGHSMGGGGTWNLGAKYADVWAAIGPISSGIEAEYVDLDKLKDMPVIVCHGDADALAPVERARTMVARMKELDMTYTYWEKPGGTHSLVGESLPRIFDFFNKHTRSAK